MRARRDWDIPPLASSPGSQKKWEEEERNESLVSTVFRERTNLPRNDKL